MMTLMFDALNEPLAFEENVINELIIESQDCLYDFCSELKESLNGAETNIVLSDDNEPISINKNAVFISDIFGFDINEKSVMTKLYSVLTKELNNGEYTEKINALNNAGEDLINSALENYTIPVIMSGNADLTQILKAYEVQFESDEGLSLAEKIINYLDVHTDFFNTRLFIMLNLKDFIGFEEMNLLYKQIFMKKYNVLIVSSSHKYKCEHEHAIIIDKDLCVI